MNLWGLVMKLSVTTAPSTRLFLFSYSYVKGSSTHHGERRIKAACFCSALADIYAQHSPLKGCLLKSVSPCIVPASTPMISSDESSFKYLSQGANQVIMYLDDVEICVRRDGNRILSTIKNVINQSKKSA